jgi:hypothetical protein
METEYVLAKIGKDDILFMGDNGETRSLQDALKFEEPTDIEDFTFISTKAANQILRNLLAQES